MESHQCPKCCSSNVVSGSLSGVGESGVAVFIPRGLRFTAWLVRNPGVGLSNGSLCCLACGLVWTHAKPEEVRATIEKHGNALAKELLEVMEWGPYFDVPDLPEARNAADGVVEIDSLIMDGRQPAATRRYRELTHCTWDQAASVIRRWLDLARREKLALFGWRPKESESTGDPVTRDHPMRDRLLDG